jgi:hypothetical protein
MNCFFRPYTRTFIYLILHSSYEVRKQAYDIIRRLVNNLRSSETDISLAVLNGLSSYLDHYQILVNKKKWISKGKNNCYLLFRMNLRRWMRRINKRN